jgi:hypothetical protein
MMQDNLSRGNEATAALEQEPEQVPVERFESSRADDPYVRAVQDSFREADEMGAVDIPEYTAEEIPDVPDRRVYKNLLKETVTLLKQSDAVKKARQEVKAGRDVDEQLVKAVFRAYDNAVREAMRRVNMSDEQRSRIKHETLGELNYSLRSVILQSVRKGGGEALRPKLWAILAVNPCMALYKHLDSNMMRRVLRNSLMRGNSDQVKADLKRFNSQLHKGEETDPKVARFMAEVGNDNELKEHLPK